MAKSFYDVTYGFFLAKYMKSVDLSLFFDKKHQDFTNVDKISYLT